MKSRGMQNSPLFLPACLPSWDIGLLLLWDRDLGHQLPWCSGLWTQTGIIYHWLSWASSLHMEDCRTSQIPLWGESIPHNKSLSIEINRYLSFPPHKHTHARTHISTYMAFLMYHFNELFYIQYPHGMSMLTRNYQNYQNLSTPLKM